MIKSTFNVLTKVHCTHSKQNYGKQIEIATNTAFNFKTNPSMYNLVK